MEQQSLYSLGREAAASQSAPQQMEAVPPSMPGPTICDMIEGALWLAGF